MPFRNYNETGIKMDLCITRICMWDNVLNLLSIIWILFMVNLQHGQSSLTANECPLRCTCLQEFSKVLCKNASLTRVPSLPSLTTSVNLQHNDISIIYNSSFDVTTIQILNLENNGIIFIEVGAFLSLTYLKVLQLGKNHLSHLPKDIFQMNRNLEILDIHSNSFTEIPDYIMFPLHNLQILNMSYNSLTTPMLGQGFKVTTKLETIDLSGNNLVALESHVFQATLWWDDKVTHYLNLSYCNIQHIFPNSLNQLYHIDSLSLEGNNAISTEKLLLALDELSISSVEMLNLSKMNITDISQFFSLSQHRSLLHLVLSHNNIQSIGDRTFYYLENLKILDLSYNYLGTLASLDGLSSLRVLNLSHNKLKTVSETVFDGMNFLQVLNLSNNRLVELHETSFQTLFDLNTLDLGLNQLTTFTTDIGFENLETLLLHSNKLQTVQSFRMMMKLKILDLSNNNITYLGTDIFSEGQKLLNVNMSSNVLTAIHHNTFGNTTVDVLDISNNRLTTLHHYGLKKVKRLQAQRNRITDIFPNTFYKLNTIIELNIEQNQIQQVPMSFLSPAKTLRIISLSTNPIGDFLEQIEEPSKVFNALYKLEVLKLANISLNHIPINLFNKLSSLKTLDLSRNSLLTMEPHVFNDTKYLQFLNLSHNLLQVPSTNVLQHLQHLDAVDFTSNPFWCTCDLIPFQQWLIKTDILVVNARFYYCEGPEKLEGKPLLHINLDSSDCSFTEKYIILIALGCALLFLLICILSVGLYQCRKRKQRKLNKLDYNAVRNGDQEPRIQFNPQGEIELQSKKDWL